ncbi:hypothetical protein [Modestobacter sp. URMC 112]
MDPAQLRDPATGGRWPVGRSAELAELPTGRLADGEIVPTAVLLASEDGSYHVGQTLGPNGGDVML